MVKCYFYNGEKINVSEELRHSAVIELIAPSKNEIDDVAKFLDISKQDITALINGNFDNIYCLHVFATKFNSSLSKFDAMFDNGIFKNVGKEDITMLVDNVFGKFDKTDSSHIVTGEFKIFLSRCNVMLASNLDYMIITRDKPALSDEENEYLIRSLWGSLTVPGYVNLDVRDIETILEKTQKVYISSSCKLGELSQKLLSSINQSKKILCNITIKHDTDLDRIAKVLKELNQQIPQDTVVICPVGYGDSVCVSVIG